MLQIYTQGLVIGVHEATAKSFLKCYCFVPLFVKAFLASIVLLLANT